MDRNYWLERWQLQEIGFNQSSPNVLLQKLFPEFSLEPEQRVLVPLCGKSVDMLWLMQQGMNVVGVELSEEACKQFFKENALDFVIEKNETGFTVYRHPSITLFAGDFFSLAKAMLGKIDLVYDRAALIALPLELRKKYVGHIKTIIETSTQQLLITTFYDQNTMEGPPFSVSFEEVQSLYGKDEVEILFEKVFTDIAPHLYAKGLRLATEYAFKITL